MEKPKNELNKGIAVGLISAIALAGLYGCSPAGAEGPTKREPSVSAPAIPGGEKTPTPSSTETAPTNEIRNYSSYKESPEYSALTAEQKAEIDRMDMLDFDEYSIVPDAKQFAYAKFMIEVYEPYATEMLEKYQVAAGDGRLTYNPSYFASFGNETLATPAQKLESNSMLATTISILSMTNGDASVVNAEESKVRTKKMQSYVYAKNDQAPPEYNHGTPYYNVLSYIDRIGDTLDTDLSTPGFERNGYVLRAVPTYSKVESNRDYNNGPAKIMFYTCRLNGVEEVVRLISTPLTDIKGNAAEKWRIDNIGSPGELGYSYDAIATS